MLLDKISKGIAPSLLSACLLLSGCGGGSGGGGGEASEYQGVDGPLDVLQEPLSNQVLGGLSDALSGTPLEAPIECIDQLVVQDVLDVVDTVLSVLDPSNTGDLQGATAQLTDNLRSTVTELLSDLPNLLASLVGASDCTSGSGFGGGNPLAGTDLADLGASLEAIFSNNGDVALLDLHQIAYLLQDISNAFSDGIISAAGPVTDAPILGGTLVTLDSALADLANLVTAVADQDGDAAGAAVGTTVENLLNNVLTQIVPIAFIEDQSGQIGLFSQPIASAVGTLSGQLSSGLPAVLDPLFDGLAFVQNILTAIFADGLLAGLDNADGGSGPLAGILAPLNLIGERLSAGNGDGGLTGTPLDILLDPIVGLLLGGGDTIVGECPLANTPLSPVCTVTETLLSSGGPLAPLAGLIESILSTLGQILNT